MKLNDAWNMFLEAYKEQRDIERKKRAFVTLTRANLNYTLIEEIVGAASRQQPGFYSILKFPDGTTWEFGKKDRPSAAQHDGATF